MNSILNTHVSVPKYVDHTKSTNEASQVQQQNLATNAADHEQHMQAQSQLPARVSSVNTQQVISPSTETINQLQNQSTQRFPDNANGLGRVAIQSYGQYAQSGDDYSDKVKVNLSA